VLFGSSIKVLLNKRKTISGTTPLLAVAGVLGILITWVSVSHANTLLSGDGSHRVIFPPPFPRQHIITDGVRTVYAFKQDQVPLGSDLYYANVASALSLIKTSLYLVITIIFDAFIVSFRIQYAIRCQPNSPRQLHRCFVVWDRNLLVILLPFIVWLADIGLYALLEVSMNECPLIKSGFHRYWYRSRSGPVWPHQGRQRLH